MTQPNTTANVVLTADVAPYQQSMGAANQSTNSLINSVDKLSKGIDNLFKSAGRKLEIFSAADMAAIGLATRSLAQLDQQMGQVRATTSLAGGTSVPALTNNLRALSTQIPMSTAQLAQLATTLSSLGVRGAANITSLTKTFAQLQEVTGEAGTGLAQNLVQLTRSMGQNLDPQKMKEYASAVANVSANLGVSATAVTNFASAIQPMGKLFGLTETQLIGLSGAFSKAGADGMAAANAFSQIAVMINQDIQTGNPQLRQFADLMGISTTKLTQMAKTNPAEVFTDLFAALQAKGPAATRILQGLNLDGIRTMNAIQAVSQGGGIAAALGLAQQGAADPGRLAKAASNSTNDLNSQMERLSATMKELTSGPFVALERVLTKVVEGINYLLSALVKLADLPGIKQLIQAAGLLAAVVAPFIGLAGAILTILPLLAKLGLAWQLLFSKTGISIVGGVRDAIRGVGTEAESAAAKAIAASAAGTGPRVGILQRGAYAAGGLLGTGLRQIPGVGGPPGTGPGIATRLADAGLAGTRWAARTFVTSPAGLLVNEAGIGLRSGGNAMFQAAYGRPSEAGGFWSDVRSRAGKWAQGTGFFDGGGSDAAAKADAKLVEQTEKTAKSFETVEKRANPLAGVFAGVTKSAVAQTEATAKQTVAETEEAAAAQAASRGLMDVAASAAMAGLRFGGSTVAQAGKLAGSGAMAAGRGLLGLAGAMGPIGWGLTAATVGLPMYQAANRKIAGDEQGTLVGNVNSFNEAIGRATVSVGDFAAKTQQQADNSTKTLQAWSPEEVKKAQDSAFKSVGYSSGNQAEKVAQLVQSTLTSIQKGGPLDSGAQQQLRMQLEKLFPNNLQGAKDVYTNLAKGSDNFTKATQSATDTYKTYQNLGDRFSSAFASSINPFRGAGARGQTARTAITQGLEGLNLASATGGTAADQQQGGAQFLAALAGATRQFSVPVAQGGAAGTSEVKPFFKDLASKMGLPGSVGNATSLQDFVGRMFSSRDANVRNTATRLFGPQGSIDFNNPAALQATVQQRMDAANRQVTVQQAQQARSAFDTYRLGNLGLARGGTVASAVTQVLGGSQDPRQQTQAIYGTAAALRAQGNSAADSQKRLSDWAKSLTNLDDPAVQQFIAGVQQQTTTLLDLGRATQSLPDQIKSVTDQLGQIDLTMPGGQDAFNQLAGQQQQLIQSGVSQAQQYLQQLDQLQVQQQQSTQDYNRQRSRASQAFNLQEARSEESYGIQRQRSIQEFQIQEQRSTEDFNRSMLQSQQDYQRSRARSTRDFIYQEQQYVKSVAQSLDPWTQVQAQSVTDAQQALANMTQQNGMFAKAGQQLTGLRRMGLSQNVIDVLGLSDPKNMQQLNRFYTDVAANPQLIQSFNKSIKGRLDWTQGLATNQSSTQWREMEHQFQTAANDAAQDFSIASQRAQDSFDRQQARAGDDFRRQLANNAADFARMMAQSEQDFGISMAQMAQDQQIQAKRALDAINRYTTGALGTNDQILKRALDASRGSMHAYFQELIKEMGVAQAAMANADQQNQANAPGAGTGKGTTPIASKDHEKMMIQALEYAGVQPNTANLNALNTIITNESGWNPNAINLTDSNAKAGHPSQGLMQTIPGTFNAYRSPSLSSSITDPLANMVAGINYAMHTYGSLLNVPGVVSTGQGHPYIGYATGVLATSPTRALIGEAGPEAVLPLNNQGVDFLLNLAKQLNSDGWSARNSNRYASKLEPTISTTHVDSSTNFTGPVTVQAQDPNAMANALKNKARMAALTRPDLTTGVLT